MSTSTNKPDLSSLTMPRKILVVAALVLLVDSFLPWYHVSVSALGVHVSANASGWHEVGTVVWLLTIVLLVAEATRIFGVLPLDDARAELLSLAIAALTLLFGLIYVIQRLSDGHLGYGFYIGIVAMVALGYAAFGMYREGDAMTTLKNLQSPGAGSGDAGAPPTA
jgi:hypothetical protein